MDPVYQALKTRTHEIAARYPAPGFYRHFARENDYSRGFFDTDPLISDLKQAVSGPLGENLGHGFQHAAKVSMDAGTLILIEGALAGYSKSYMDRLLLLVQSAGLLHDICRVEKNHAQRGADMARRYLTGFPLTGPEVDHICQAIRNHEAFRETTAAPSRAAGLVSDCLYDADKFRWGRDNFSHTLWDMLTYSKVPVREFVSHYPEGMGTLVKIRETFRTRTGKKYGPRFVDIGLGIGRELYRVMETEFRLI